MSGFHLFTIQVILTPRVDNYNAHMHHYNPTHSFIPEGSTAPPGFSDALPSATIALPNNLSPAPSQSILTTTPEPNSTPLPAPGSPIANGQQRLSPTAANIVTIASHAPLAMSSQTCSTRDRRKRRYRFLCF